MQDRFKFRIWDDIHREMLDLQEQDVNPYNISDIPQNNIMQCTGLKDKYGKLIYEGDIAINEGTVCVINWDNDKCAFFGETASEYFAFEEDITIEDFEIIGNIYENPGLLEKS